MSAFTQVFPTSGSSQARSGSFGTAWAAPSNVTTGNSTDATMDHSGAGNSADAYTEWLSGSFPALTLPAGAELVGFEAKVSARKTGGPGGKNAFVDRLETGGGVLLGSGSADLTSSYQTFTYGSPTSLSGVTLADLSSGSFSLRVSLKNSSSFSGIGTLSTGVDSLSYIAYYSLRLRGTVRAAEVGGQFPARPVRVWDGSSWKAKAVKYWNGASWVKVGS